MRNITPKKMQYKTALYQPLCYLWCPPTLLRKITNKPLQEGGCCVWVLIQSLMESED